MSALVNRKTTTPRHMGHTHCAICSMRTSVSQRIINVGTRNLQPPFTILGNLKNAGLIPVDQKGDPICTPNKWRDALHIHIQHCLNQDFDLYERGWQARQKDAAFQADLLSRVSQYGEGGEISDEDLRLKMAIVNAVSDEPGGVMNLTAERLLNRADLLQVFRELMPTILAQQLQIIAMAQADYMNGCREDIPLKEFNSVQKCLEVLKMVIGEYGIETTIGE